MKTDRDIMGWGLWMLAQPIFGALSLERWWRENRAARKAASRRWA